MNVCTTCMNVHPGTVLADTDTQVATCIRYSGVRVCTAHAHVLTCNSTKPQKQKNSKNVTGCSVCHTFAVCSLYLFIYKRTVNRTCGTCTVLVLVPVRQLTTSADDKKTNHFNIFNALSNSSRFADESHVMRYMFNLISESFPSTPCTAIFSNKFIVKLLLFIFATLCAMPACGVPKNQKKKTTTNNKQTKERHKINTHQHQHRSTGPYN